ncbi:hypothetical protein AB9P05_00475 [Roseivirga sp. BDSF3-8]|uniref:hypothetical protein n=1 Tax=Roseivirga sp. BDSF3-8 TaxID=3241598 RepID=UPI003531C5A8
MGYMGFGMRRIDYTRKPKKLFAAYKEVYGEHIEAVSKSAAPAMATVPGRSWERHSYKPFDEYKGYVIFRRILYFGPLLFLISMILFNTLS